MARYANTNRMLADTFPELAQIASSMLCLLTSFLITKIIPSYFSFPRYRNKESAKGTLEELRESKAVPPRFRTEDGIRSHDRRELERNDKGLVNPGNKKDNKLVFLILSNKTGRRHFETVWE